MLLDDRARRVLWNFHRQWLGLDRVLGDEHLVRTPEVDPAWTAATPVAATRESQLFVENVLLANGSLRNLLTSRRAWVNGEMARIYGVAAPADPAAWSEVELPETERAGILTRVAFLAGHSHRGATSPPIRGNGIELRFFCQPPISPPPGVDLSQPKADPKQGPQTNRMLFEARTAPRLVPELSSGAQRSRIRLRALRRRRPLPDAGARSDHRRPRSHLRDRHRPDLRRRHRALRGARRELDGPPLRHAAMDALRARARALGRARLRSPMP